MDIKRICATCGTVRKDPNTDKCANLHDSWITLADFDNPERYFVIRGACSLLKVQKDALRLALVEGTDISKPNSSAVCASLDTLVNPDKVIAFIDEDGRRIDPQPNQALQVVYNARGEIVRVEVWQQLTDTTILRVKTWVKAKINFIIKQGVEEEEAISL